MTKAKGTKGPRLLLDELEARGITAAALAKQLKVNKSTVCMWIHGKYSPGSDMRDQLELWSESRIPRSAWRARKAQRAINAAASSSTQVPR